MCYSNCPHEDWHGECTASRKPSIHAHCREDEDGNPPMEEDDHDYEEICTTMHGLRRDIC